MNVVRFAESSEYSALRLFKTSQNGMVPHTGAQVLLVRFLCLCDKVTEYSLRPRQPYIALPVGDLMESVQ